MEAPTSTDALARCLIYVYQSPKLSLATTFLCNCWEVDC